MPLKDDLGLATVDSSNGSTMATTSTKGRKLAKAANKNQLPVAPVQSADVQSAVDAGKLDLQTHFDVLNQIGQQVAVAKVEMSRAMPQMIAQKVDEILAANPIDVDAGALRGGF
jgi:hypothetical protein